eukprot:TRINITY_DN7633_c0_g1_i1.p1 TRINITY_DN7633_c0_g1~~TRINITY_DN7633_c0_g1_i1.p1  ORF type:complete len:158 (-),score=39.61 TRINITY_DN7633_c0_g1_i1:115-588(-)
MRGLDRRGSERKQRGKLRGRGLLLALTRQLGQRRHAVGDRWPDCGANLEQLRREGQRIRRMLEQAGLEGPMGKEALKPLYLAYHTIRERIEGLERQAEEDRSAAEKHAEQVARQQRLSELHMEAMQLKKVLDKYELAFVGKHGRTCLLYTSPSPRDS